GLLPDGREGAIVEFSGKAQWMPMIGGLRKKVRNSGEIATWEAHVVYPPPPGCLRHPVSGRSPRQG
uniref:recombinase RecT n=1 Tax=Klebsiella aerogenes TaxID=548 RepID=UPI00195373C4